MIVRDAGIERLTMSAVPAYRHKKAARTERAAVFAYIQKCSVMALVLFTLALAFALLLAARFLASTADRRAAGGAEPRLVLEQARRDLGAIGNEFAANALRITGAGMLTAALHVVGAL